MLHADDIIIVYDLSAKRTSIKERTNFESQRKLEQIQKTSANRIQNTPLKNKSIKNRAGEICSLISTELPPAIGLSILSKFRKPPKRCSIYVYNTVKPKPTDCFLHSRASFQFTPFQPKGNSNCNAIDDRHRKSNKHKKKIFKKTDRRKETRRRYPFEVMFASRLVESRVGCTMQLWLLSYGLFVLFLIFMCATIYALLIKAN